MSGQAGWVRQHGSGSIMSGQAGWVRQHGAGSICQVKQDGSGSMGQVA